MTSVNRVKFYMNKMIVINSPTCLEIKIIVLPNHDSKKRLQKQEENILY